MWHIEKNGMRDEQVDEINRYLEMRYPSTIEACWRIFHFNIDYQDPLVKRLNFHLENDQQVIFPHNENIENIVRKGVRTTNFTE
jgi:hypothetical protein